MAYRFTPTSNYVRFAPAPFTGYTFGAVTMACLVKRSSSGGSVFDILVGIIDAALNFWRTELTVIADQLNMGANVTSAQPTAAVTGTTAWYTCVCTWSGSGAPRLHVHNGSSWVHENGANSITATAAVGGTDIFTVSNTFGGTNSLGGDVVCAGIKKASSSDVTVETLTQTAFQSWRNFGFDWLVGFDTSLQAAGLLQDQASPGTGNETSKVGTSVVSDPPGWSWTGGAAAPNSGLLAFT